MTSFGFSLMCELHGPRELVQQAQRAEAAGFDFVTISDHYHPWLYSHGHSPFAWSVLGGVAATTERIRMISLVTCPIIRYHPAIVAQMAATMGAMSGGRFELGLGAGENLNEHVVGHGWPPADTRHEMLAEAINVIRELWGGQYVTHHGDHYDVEDARLYTLPDEPVPLHVAVSGEQSIELAAQHADGMVAVDPDPELVGKWNERAGEGKPRIGQLAMSVLEDEDEALRLAHERFRFAAQGWKVMAELPNPINFEAATAPVRAEDMAEDVPCGDDPAKHLEAIQEWVDAGFDHVALVQVPPDQETFFRFWEEKLRPELG
jgi:G6PDH family F420-dependent oxidoreductase